jgi:hypothetical protein
MPSTTPMMITAKPTLTNRSPDGTFEHRTDTIGEEEATRRHVRPPDQTGRRGYVHQEHEVAQTQSTPPFGTATKPRFASGSGRHTITPMSPESAAPGCRDTAVATSFLLGLAMVFMTVGLTLTRQDGCSGACETLGLALLYAGGPVSAMFGVLLGGLTLAWPLDITFWVAAGFITARWAGIRGRSPLAVALVLALIALVYGLVLSQMVEIVV